MMLVTVRVAAFCVLTVAALAVRPAEAADVWASIAVGFFNNNTQATWCGDSERATQGEAERIATDSCKNKGFMYVQTAMSVRNGAAAIVIWNRSGWAPGWGATVEEAIANAKARAESLGAVPGTQLSVGWIRTSNSRATVSGTWGNTTDQIPIPRALMTPILAGVAGRNNLVPSTSVALGFGQVSQYGGWTPFHFDFHHGRIERLAIALILRPTLPLQDPSFGPVFLNVRTEYGARDTYRVFANELLAPPQWSIVVKDMRADSIRAAQFQHLEAGVDGTVTVASAWAILGVGQNIPDSWWKKAIQDATRQLASR